MRENLKAAEIYKKLGNKKMQIDCIKRALNGANEGNLQSMVDSILSAYSTDFDRYNDSIPGLLEERLMTYINYRSKDELNELMQRLNPKVTEHNIRIIAQAYDAMGDTEGAIKQLPDLGSMHSAEDSLALLAVRSEFMENEGHYREALTNLQDYLKLYEKYMCSLYNNNLLFTQKKYELTVEASKALVEKEKERNRVIIFLLLAIIAAMTAGIALYIKHVNMRELELKFSGLETELENEKSKLTQLQEKHSEFRALIQKRLDAVNSLIAYQITDNTKYTKEYDLLIQEIFNEKEKFMSSLIDAIRVTYPRFTHRLQDAELSNSEWKLVSLLVLGMEIKEAIKYMKRPGAYNDSREIRRKLKLKETERDLGKYLRKIILEERNSTPLPQESV